VPGGALFDEICRKEHFCEELAADVISQLLSAIAYCHERGIIHKNLAAEHIRIALMTENRMIVRVDDFSAVETFMMSTRRKEVEELPFCMAPEALKGGKFNEKCDSWSVGIFLYIMLSGIPPYQNMNDPEELKKEIAACKITMDSIFGIW